MVGTSLKEAAATFGLSATMLSTHCSKIECASYLAGYGLSDSELKKFIGWKSDSSLLYQSSSEKVPIAVRAGATCGTLTVSDVANLIPAGRSGELQSAGILAMTSSASSIQVSEVTASNQQYISVATLYRGVGRGVRLAATAEGQGCQIQILVVIPNPRQSKLCLAEEVLLTIEQL